MAKKDYSHPLDLVLDRPIAFQRSFRKITGSTVAALFLSQAYYWSKRHDDDHGWFYNTQEDWEDETGLSRSEQETARKVLKRLGILEEKRVGVPARLYYRIHRERIAELLNFQFAGIPQTTESSVLEPLNQDGDIPADINKNPETATETANMEPQESAQNLGANAPVCAPSDLVQERVEAFPQDCHEGAQLMFSTFGLIPPEKPAPDAKGGDFALWINGIRELSKLATEYNTPLARAFELTHARWNRAPFSAAHPGALKKVMASVLATDISKRAKRVKEQSSSTPEAGSNFVPNPLPRPANLPPSKPKPQRRK